MNCIFCNIINGEIPTKKIYEDEDVIAFMDISPICDGHSLIVPKKHIDSILDANNDVIDHMFNVAKKLAPQIMNKVNEKGFSLSINYGEKQEVKHVHMHILPNYEKAPTQKPEDVYKTIMD